MWRFTASISGMDNLIHDDLNGAGLWTVKRACTTSTTQGSSAHHFYCTNIQAERRCWRLVVSIAFPFQLLPHASSRFWAQPFLFSTHTSIHDCPIYVGPPRLRTVPTPSPFPPLVLCTLLPFPLSPSLSLSSVCPPYISHCSPCSPSCSRHQYTWVLFCCVIVPP